MAKKNNNENNTVWISGRRKTAVARIKMTSEKGEFLVNDMSIQEYFPQELDQQKLLKPFRVAGRDIKGFDVSVKVEGSGKKAQLEAIMLGVSKALEEMEPDLRPLLKDAGLLTRDPRMKERKKYGHKKARKSPQFSKR